MEQANPRVRGTTISDEDESEIVEGDVEPARHDGDESFESARHTAPILRSVAIHPPLDALNTHTALTLYLLIVFVTAARTVVLTLIKVQLNKTKTENNHFCLTGKMARYVAEAVTTHAPLPKHMFFRLELCAGLLQCCNVRQTFEARRTR